MAVSLGSRQCEQLLNFLAGGGRCRSTRASDSERCCRIGIACRLHKRHSVCQARAENAAEGVSCADSIDGLHLVRRNRRRKGRAEDDDAVTTECDHRAAGPEGANGIRQVLMGEIFGAPDVSVGG